jgi:hypothetical protein
MSTTSKLVRVALLALPLLGAATPATANVGSVYSSTVCQWEEADHRRGFQTSVDINGNPVIYGSVFSSRYYPQHGMFHTAFVNGEEPTSLPVTCNIPRNLPLRADGMSDLEVRFRATGPFAGTRAVTCTAYSYRGDGTLAAAATRSMAVDGNNIDTTTPLDFGSAIGSSASKGYYILSCNVPTDVSLFSIYASENDGVSNN